MTARSLLSATVLGMGILTASCGGKPADDTGIPGSAGLVEVSTAVRQSAVVSVPARVRPEQTAELATRVSGMIRRVLVDVGDAVREGQNLVLLDDADVRANISRAKAELQLAQRYHARIQALEQDGAATGQELDEATARLRVAEAGVGEAQGGLTYSVLRAPFAGVVSARHADPGDLAVPGRPLLEISGTGNLVVEADLPARMVVRRGLLLSVESTSGAGDGWFAEIMRIVPVLDRSSQRFRVEARLEESDEPFPVPNSIVTLQIASVTDTVVVIPTDATFSRGQLTGVFVVRDSTLRLRWIRPGRERWSTLEVLSGVAGGEAVVRRPAAGLMDGQVAESVEVLPWTPHRQVPAP